jgi:hypothetical protein
VLANHSCVVPLSRAASDMKILAKWHLFIFSIFGLHAALAADVSEIQLP